MKTACELNLHRCTGSAAAVWMTHDRELEINLPGTEVGPDPDAMDFYDIVATSFSRFQQMEETSRKMLSELVTLSPEWSLDTFAVVPASDEPSRFALELHFCHSADLYGLWKFRFVIRQDTFEFDAFTRSQC